MSCNHRNTTRPGDNSYLNHMTKPSSSWDLPGGHSSTLCSIRQSGRTSVYAGRAEQFVTPD